MAVEYPLLDLDETEQADAYNNLIEYKPQGGPQTVFATTTADVAIYGGAAGGGKTWALLIEALRHIWVKGFSAVYFRRTMPQITNPGGLLDASYKVYPNVGGRYVSQPHEWRFKNDFTGKVGGKIKFAQLQHEGTVHNWQGAEVPLICLDELTHFTAQQFWYLVSRNRSMCGVKPYMRATCNPDADSWVAEFLAWWINQDTGFPIESRIGKIRYVARVDDKLVWASTAEELAKHLPTKEQLPEGTEVPKPKSVTFIPSKLFDNKELLKVNPEYLANLLAMPLVERERLLGGNWKIRPSAGLYFKRAWCELLDAAPAADLEIVRYYDLAGTEKRQDNDPDWTVGVKLGRDTVTGIYYVLDVIRERLDPFGVERLMVNTASHDGKATRIGWGIDPGQAGKSQSQYLARRLSGYNVFPDRESGDKITRFNPVSAQCRAGNVKIVRGKWNEEFFRCLEGFPDVAHDDDVDSFSGAFEMLNAMTKGWGIFELYRRQANDIIEAKKAEDRAAETEEIPFARGSVEYEQAIAARAPVLETPTPDREQPSNAPPKVGSVEWMMQLNGAR